VIDLDAARDGERSPEHAAVLARLARRRGTRLQVGGGFRSREHVEAALAAGVQRVLIGTLAARDPDTVAALAAEHGPRICVCADALDGSVRVAGWLEDAGESASDRFPFILITGRQLAHYNSGTQTRRTGNAELQPADLVEIHPADAAELGIAAGDRVAVASARGSVETWACLTTRVARGNVFLSFHFPEVKTNFLTSGNADPLTSCPEYKVTAVSVARVPGVHPPPPEPAKGFRQDAFDGE